MARASFSLVFALFLSLGIAHPAIGQNDGKIHLPPTISQGPGMGNIPVRSADDAQKSS